MRLSAAFPLMMYQTLVPFYDFFRHIWNSEQKHLSIQFRHKKKKTPKRKSTGKTPNIKSTSMARFLDFYKNHPLLDPSLSPLSLIFRLYKQQFLNVSVSHGIIQPSALYLSNVNKGYSLLYASSSSFNNSSRTTSSDFSKKPSINLNPVFAYF